MEPTQLISVWEGHRGVKSLVQALAERQAVVSLKGLKGSSVAMVLGAAFRLQRRPMVLVEADMDRIAEAIALVKEDAANIPAAKEIVRELTDRYPLEA